MQIHDAVASGVFIITSLLRGDYFHSHRI